MPRPLYWLVLILTCWRPAAAQDATPAFRDFRAELMLAVELNDVEAARQVLAEGAAPEINRGNPSPLTTAVLLDNLPMAVLLLRAGGDPDATEDSPLMAAVRTDSVAMTQLLFQAGATLRPDETPELLGLALRSDDAATIYRELLDHGAGVDLALRVAVENRELTAALFTLERGADVSSLGELDLLAQTGVPRERVPEVLDLAVGDDHRAAALSYFLGSAAAAGDRWLAEQVLDRGGVLTLAHLERAEIHGRDDMALFLLERMDADLTTLIARAEAEGRGELVAFLKTLRRQHVAAVVGPAVAAAALLFVLAAVVFFVRQHVQRSPRKLFAAVVRGDLERIEKLLEAGADANARFRGEPLLYVAARREDLKAARALLHHGADVDRPAAAAADGDSQWTPLHVAARSGSVSLAELFLRHGARIDARTAADKTPLDLAGAAHRDEMVHLLLERGATPRAAHEPPRTEAAAPAPAAARPAFETLILPPPDPPAAPAAAPREPSFAPSVVPTRVIPHPAAGRKKSEPG